jgi:hypothetical protein
VLFWPARALFQPGPPAAQGLRALAGAAVRRKLLMLLAPFLRRWNYTRHHEQARAPRRARARAPPLQAAGAGSSGKPFCVTYSDAACLPARQVPVAAGCVATTRLLACQCVHVAAATVQCVVHVRVGVHTLDAWCAMQRYSGPVVGERAPLAPRRSLAGTSTCRRGRT